MVYRIYVEKKPGLDNEAQALLSDAKTLLGIRGLEKVRLLNRYDAENIMLMELWYDLVQLSGEPYRYIGVNDALRKGLSDYVYSLNASFVQDTISYA